MPRSSRSSAPARCVYSDEGDIGCSTRRWEERLVLGERLYQKARREPDVAALLRSLAREHERGLPPAVWLGFEHGSSVRSHTLGVTLVAVSRCTLSPPKWAPPLSKKQRRPERSCRLYTFMGFSEEV